MLTFTVPEKSTLQKLHLQNVKKNIQVYSQLYILSRVHRASFVDPDEAAHESAHKNLCWLQIQQTYLLLLLLSDLTKEKAKIELAYLEIFLLYQCRTPDKGNRDNLGIIIHAFLHKNIFCDPSLELIKMTLMKGQNIWRFIEM